MFAWTLTGSVCDHFRHPAVTPTTGARNIIPEEAIFHERKEENRQTDFHGSCEGGEVMPPWVVATGYRL